MKKLIYLLLLCPALVFAQPKGTYWGAHFGIGESNIYEPQHNSGQIGGGGFSGSYSYKHDSHTLNNCYSIGIDYNLQFGRWLGIISGLSFDNLRHTSNVDFNIDGRDSSFSDKLNINQAIIPLCLKISIPLGKRVSVFWYGGLSTTFNAFVNYTRLQHMPNGTSEFQANNDGLKYNFLEFRESLGGGIAYHTKSNVSFLLSFHSDQNTNDEQIITRGVRQTFNFLHEESYAYVLNPRYCKFSVLVPLAKCRKNKD